MFERLQRPKRHTRANGLGISGIESEAAIMGFSASNLGAYRFVAPRKTGRAARRKSAAALLFGICLNLAVSGLSCGGGGGSSPPPPPVSAITVSVSPASASLAAGSTQQFTASVSGTSNTAVTWSVSNVTGGNATVGTVTTAGLYTAPNTVPSPGTVTVTATSQADTSKSASASVTITSGTFSLTSVDPSAAMQGPGTFTLTAVGGGFTSNSQVVFNGAAKTTTFVTAARLTVQIASGDIPKAGIFTVAVRDGSQTTSSVNFYVVPAISPQSVAVSAGASADGKDIAVPSVASPTLILTCVGLVNFAGSTGVSVSRGATVSLFLIGNGIVPGTFYVISQNSDPGANDVTVTQPLPSTFSTDLSGTCGTTGVHVSITVSPNAALVSRNILVTNTAGEISVFVGGLQITPGS